MPQLKSCGRVVVEAESMNISIIPQANISYNNSAVIFVLWKFMAAAGPLFLGRDFRYSNRPLAICHYLWIQLDSQGRKYTCNIVKKSKIYPWKEALN